ncbi:MAG: hypothetical protein ACI82F_004414 [Planctomycetota bacterium]
MTWLPWIICCDSSHMLGETDGEGYGLLALACRVATHDLAIPEQMGTRQQHAMVDLLLGTDADPAVESREGWAPLHFAAITGNVRLLQQLLGADAPMDWRLLGCDGGSPLSLTLLYGQSLAAELCRINRSPIARDPQPVWAFHWSDSWTGADSARRPRLTQTSIGHSLPFRSGSEPLNDRSS